MKKGNFKILHKDKKTRARLGVLNTPHGKVQTPSYVIVGTHAQIKCLKPADIKKTKTQLVICNTYHLWEKAPAKAARSKDTFLIKNLKTKIPTMTDSGGFQVFSLGFGKENKVGKILDSRKIKGIRRKNIKITDKGVHFMIDGRRRFLGPELSMDLQRRLGANIIFAFDECTSPLDGFEYNKKALKRTEKWAKICLEKYDKERQMLFGIVQGGKYKSLRIKSAKFVASQPFDGIGIGGSFGKDEMIKTLEWIVPHLPEEKPRHLLGIGRIRDIFGAVENGMDTFDCVIPTREARHGRIWTATGAMDIRKSIYASDPSVLEKNCRCAVCAKGISRAKINRLFKSDKKEDGQRWATIHNVYFFNNLLENIRKSIRKGEFLKFKKDFLSRAESRRT